MNKWTVENYLTVAQLIIYECNFKRGRKRYVPIDRAPAFCLYIVNIVYVVPAVADSDQKYANELLLQYLIKNIVGQKCLTI